MGQVSVYTYPIIVLCTQTLLGAFYTAIFTCLLYILTELYQIIYNSHSASIPISPHFQNFILVSTNGL
jgi:hypothetical protein